jgi:hypothetical protein
MRPEEEWRELQKHPYEPWRRAPVGGMAKRSPGFGRNLILVACTLGAGMWFFAMPWFSRFVLIAVTAVLLLLGIANVRHENR